MNTQAENTAAQPAQAPSAEDMLLAPRLRDIQVDIRADLEISRHLNRNQPSYIIRDPITFHSHHLTLADYKIVVRINSEKTLGEIFKNLIKEGLISQADEERFYQFIFSLHRQGFLNLPISDDKSLYRRYEAKKAASRKAKLLSFLFLRIPLFNPNELLYHTVNRFKFFFTKQFFFVWLIAMVLSAGIIAARWHDLIKPINGILATQNLIMFWFLFVGLKVIHEFGHAYACKVFGGDVPEMGVLMIIFTPCAYVDASTAWGFSSKKQRLIVSLAGMYFESIIAALALLLWSVTEPSLINSLAYQAFLLSSVVTVGFNINPLMRYDGYYIFSDLLEMPNLRQKATTYVRSFLKRFTLGIKTPQARLPWKTRMTLLSYGLAAGAYRSLIVLGIAGLIASKLFLIGLFLACGYIGMTIFKLAKDTVQYLWLARETQPVRRRAIALSVMIMVGIPLFVLAVPLPSKMIANGMLTTSSENILRAETPGFIRDIFVQPGQQLSPGDTLVQMVNPDHATSIAEAKALIESASLRIQALEVDDQAKSFQERRLLSFFNQKLDRLTKESNKLKVVSDQSGLVVECVKPTDQETFLNPGDPVAMVCSGPWILRALITGEDFTAIEPTVGQSVQCRIPSRPDTFLEGTVTRVAESGSRKISMPSLTHIAGGGIAVEVTPQSLEARQPYFEITIEFDSYPPDIRRGMTAQARFDGPMQPLGTRMYRKLLRFLNKLQQS